jgi:exodeoxyribonuclease VIII
MIIESNEVYHANPAISHSKLETFRRRPALYCKKHVTKEIRPEAPTAAFRIGSAGHTLILEPTEWTNRYAIKPEGIDRRTKDGKEKWAEFEMANLGKTVIDQEEAAQVTAMATAVRNNPLASILLGAGSPELSWRTAGKLPLQCRTDWFNAAGCELTEGRAYVADVKTVESLNVGEYGSFERSVFNFGYHRQAGFYLPLITEILSKPVFDFFFVAVEKCEPYGVAVYRLTDDAVALGQDETVKDLVALKKCLDTNDWPNIEPTMRTLGVPSWYKGGAA